MANPLDPKLIRKLEALEERAAQLSASLSDPQILADRDRFREASRSFAELDAVVQRFRAYRELEDELRELEQRRRSGDDGAEGLEALERRRLELAEEIQRLNAKRSATDKDVGTLEQQLLQLRALHKAAREAAAHVKRVFGALRAAAEQPAAMLREARERTTAATTSTECSSSIDRRFNTNTTRCTNTI